MINMVASLMECTKEHRCMIPFCGHEVWNIRKNNSSGWRWFHEPEESL